MLSITVVFGFDVFSSVFPSVVSAVSPTSSPAFSSSTTSRLSSSSSISSSNASPTSLSLPSIPLFTHLTLKTGNSGPTILLPLAALTALGVHPGVLGKGGNSPTSPPGTGNSPPSVSSQTLSRISEGRSLRPFGRNLKMGEGVLGDESVVQDSGEGVADSEGGRRVR